MAAAKVNFMRRFKKAMVLDIWGDHSLNVIVKVFFFFKYEIHKLAEVE